MPPRRAKRKAATPEAELSGSETATAVKPVVKRTKPGPTSGAGAASTSSNAAAGSSDAIPTNKTMPTSLSFTRPATDALRIVAWNVCGLKTSQKKGFNSYIEAEDPDILVLTETKLSTRPVDSFLTNRYAHQYWNDAVKGHGGTAILSKVPALNVTYTIPDHADPTEVIGRIVTLEFSGLFIVGTYVPNAGEKLKFMERKKAWNTAFEAHIHSLDAQKPVMWMGDLNVVPTAKDIKRAKPNYNKSAGYTEIEINGFNQILAPSATAGSQRLVDVWRDRHPSDEHYTYFSYRFDCRSKGIGWRLDFFVLSERLLSRVKMCEIRHEAYGASDHLPIVLDIEGPL